MQQKIQLLKSEYLKNKSQKNKENPTATEALGNAMTYGPYEKSNFFPFHARQNIEYSIHDRGNGSFTAYFCSYSDWYGLVEIGSIFFDGFNEGQTPKVSFSSDAIKKLVEDGYSLISDSGLGVDLHFKLLPQQPTSTNEKKVMQFLYAHAQARRWLLCNRTNNKPDVHCIASELLVDLLKAPKTADRTSLDMHNGWDRYIGTLSRFCFLGFVGCMFLGLFFAHIGIPVGLFSGDGDVGIPELELSFGVFISFLTLASVPFFLCNTRSIRAVSNLWEEARKLDPEVVELLTSKLTVNPEEAKRNQLNLSEETPSGYDPIISQQKDFKSNKNLPGNCELTNLANQDPSVLRTSPSNDKI